MHLLKCIGVYKHNDLNASAMQEPSEVRMVAIANANCAPVSGPGSFALVKSLFWQQALDELYQCLVDFRSIPQIVLNRSLSGTERTPYSGETVRQWSDEVVLLRTAFTTNRLLVIWM